MGEGIMSGGEPAPLNSGLLDGGLQNLTEGSGTERTGKTQSCDSQEGDYNERRRRA